MRALKIFILITMLFLVQPIQAQPRLPKSRPVVPSGTIATNILRNSQRINANLQRQLSLLVQPPVTPPKPKQFKIPKAPKPISFLVQSGPKSDKTASAFALKVDDLLVGVTAGHVMNNIAHYNQPHLAFPLENGEKAEFRITDWRMTNYNGTDVAVFRIPQEALPYVQPLEISKEPVQPLQTASIAGFANNAPLWLRNEEILFTGAQRFLLRDTSDGGLNGMCGSPLLINGKVAGLYVGFFPAGRLLSSEWARPIINLFDAPLPSLHQAAPIHHIFPLVADLKQKGAMDNVGTMMKVLGKPVAMLNLKDQLFSVSLMRGGFLKKTVYLGPLTDPEHLENFFELQENDVLRVEIFPNGYTFSRGKATYYDVNVSTGEVSSFQR